MSSQTVSMLVFGEGSCGKSELLRKFVDPNALFMPGYNKTVGADYLVKDKGEYHFQIWDASGDSKFDGLLVNFMRKADIALLCLDLSQPRSKLETIAHYLEMLGASNSQMAVIVVGVRCDLAEEATINDFFALQKVLKKPVRALCVTSAKTADGMQDLSQLVNDVLKLNYQSSDIIIQDRGNVHDPMATAIALAGVDGQSSMLHARLCELELALNQLSDKKKRHQLAAEAEQLIRALQDPVRNKAEAIHHFEQNCQIWLQGSSPWIKNTLKVVASVLITATVFVLAATVGFGIGFALGFWTGPGAFFTGIAGGIGVSLLVGSALLGALAGSFTLYGLFKTSNQEKVVEAAIGPVVDTAHLNIGTL